MTKELFNLLDEYIKCVVENKVNEFHPITTDIRLNLERAETLKTKISRLIAITCGDSK